MSGELESKSLLRNESSHTAVLGECPPLLLSSLLEAEGFRHAFFTRLGGVSEPPFDSLNVAAVSTGDSPDPVAENLRRCALALGVPSALLYHLSQVHGTDVCVVDGSEDPKAVLLRKGDLVASCVPGVACGVRSADCVPILLGDRRSGVVIAVHSGWRGTAANAAAAAVAALHKLATNAEIVAAIGPHIEACCFEVGDDVAAQLSACSSLSDTAVDRSRARPHVDLRRIVRAQLVDAGVRDAAIDDVRGCSCCDSARFFSFRRDGAKSGRLLSAIVARGPR